MLSLYFSSLDLSSRNSRRASLRSSGKLRLFSCFDLGLSLAGLVSSRCEGSRERGTAGVSLGTLLSLDVALSGWAGARSWGPRGAAATESSGSMGTSETRWVQEPGGTGWSSPLAPGRASRLERLQVWNSQQTFEAHLWGREPAKLSILLPVAICSCRKVAAKITHVLCVSEEPGCKSSPLFVPCDEGARKNDVSSAGKAKLPSLISHLNLFGI